MKCKGVNSVLSASITTSNRTVNRTDNIKLACRGSQFAGDAGEEFSMNGELGPGHTNEQANNIGNELVPYRRGGQVSSTLYARSCAGLKLRTNTIRAALYISPGGDATITESSIDSGS